MSTAPRCDLCSNQAVTDRPYGTAGSRLVLCASCAAAHDGGPVARDVRARAAARSTISSTAPEWLEVWWAQ